MTPKKKMIMIKNPKTDEPTLTEVFNVSNVSPDGLYIKNMEFGNVILNGKVLRVQVCLSSNRALWQFGE